MCLDPRIIYNRSTFLNLDCSPGFLEVPCGHCPECQDLKSNEYRLRGYVEWKDCQEKGGFSYFETLTYNEKSCHSRMWNGIKTFCPEDLRLFHKKLRKSIEGVCSYRYIQASEYGGLFHRPHYHLIFFIYPQKNVDKSWLLRFFRDSVLSAWKEPLRDKDGNILYKFDKHGLRKMRMRSLGFIDSLKTLENRVLNRVDAISYCSKYITKDQDYCKEIYKKFEEIVKDRDLLSNSQEYDDLKNEMKSVLPFHRQSQGFGGSLLYTLKEDIEKLVSAPFYKNLALGSSPIMLPLYYIRKLFYDCVPSGMFDPDTGRPCMTYRPNRYGKLFLMYQLDKRIDKYETKYINALSLFPMYDSEHGNDRIHEILGSRSIRDFVIYKLVYKGHFHNNFAFKPNTDNYRNFYLKTLEVGDTENCSYIDDYDKRIGFREFLCANVINDTISDCWYGFDEIDSIFNAYFRQRGKSISDARELVRFINHKLKKIQNRL